MRVLNPQVLSGLGPALPVGVAGGDERSAEGSVCLCPCELRCARIKARYHAIKAM